MAFPNPLEQVSIPSVEQVSIPSDESLMTPVERRLRELDAQRKQRSSEGKQDTIEQQREYEQVLRQNLILDLEDLRMIEMNERSGSMSGGHVRSIDALVAAGYLPQEAIQDHSIKIQPLTKDIALKRLEALREVDERLALLEGALCLPDDECSRLHEAREQEVHQLEGEWGVN